MCFLGGVFFSFHLGFMGHKDFNQLRQRIRILAWGAEGGYANERAIELAKYRLPSSRDAFKEKKQVSRAGFGVTSPMT